MKTPKKAVSRRKFIKKTGLLSSVPVIAAGLPASSLADVQDANQFLRLGWIGVGGRGTSLLDRALRSVSVSTLKVNLPPLKDSTELAIQSFARSIREDKEPLANVDAGRHATLMSLLGRTAIHEKRVVEWKEVAL